MKNSFRNYVQTSRQQASSERLSFREQVARMQAAEKKTAAATEDMAEYQRAIYAKIAALPLSASSAQENISVHISEEGFAAMRADPSYEAWVLEGLGASLAAYNPWVPVCGGGYVVHSFGATKEDYKGESWYPGYQYGRGQYFFEEKAEDSFWERRIERQEKLQQLWEETQWRQKLLNTGLTNGVSAAYLLQFLM